MSTAEIRGRIHEYVDRADERMLRIIHSIMKGDEIDSIDALYDIEQRISVEQYNKELEESEKQIEEGNYFTQQQVEKKFA